MDRKLASLYSKLLISSALTACAVNFFFIHDGLAPGGLTGLALVIGSLTGIEIPYIVTFISVPLLLCSVFVLGNGFGIKTIIVVMLTPMFMKILPTVWLMQSISAINPYLELFISACIGGFLIGASICIALSAKSGTGGTDVLALLILHFFNGLKLENIIMVLDGLIIISTSIVHRNIILGLFSLISLFVITQTIQYFTTKRA